MKKVSPEFAKKMEEKKKQQLIKEARILAKPLSEIDIYKAIQSYQSKVPSFDPSSERIIQRDIVGIAKELNEILDKKGEGVTMSNTFISKVEKELANMIGELTGSEFDMKGLEDFRSLFNGE